MIHVVEHKEPQHSIASEKFHTPQKLYLPLAQATGKPSAPTCQLGQQVQEGELIAASDGLISANLHAPCAGKISAFEQWYHPALKRSSAIIIDCCPSPKTYPCVKSPDALTKEALLSCIQKAGIVGMGGAAFPTHVKLQPPKKIDTLIVNGCECEPYLATDYRLMVENTEEILRGVENVTRIVEPTKVIIALEDNKPQAIKNIRRIVSTKKYTLSGAEVVTLKAAYPQGGEKQLIDAVCARRVPGGKLPFDVGCLVQNVATCFAIYEAVFCAKPLIERLVSFAGDALVKPKNIWVKIGTSLKELFDNKILEFRVAPQKIISGGPMMGVALDGLEYPILKGTGGFLFLADGVAAFEETACIRCGRCADACPMRLLPLEYAKRIKRNEFDALHELYISDCMECGSCVYVCPARIPLVHYIKVGKKYAPAYK